MATKDELIQGLRVLIGEGKRAAERFTDEDWAMPAHEGGWNNRQLFAHLSATGTIVVPFVGTMASAPAGTDLGAGLDVDVMNAGLVGARADKSIAELVAELESAYGGVIEFVRTAPDETLERRATIGGYKDMAISDLLMQMVVLHGLAHIYHAASRFGRGS